MVRIVADSSSLILLAKCTLLKIVCDLFDVMVPKAVIIEVASEDLVKTYPDAALISKLTSKGAIKETRNKIKAREINNPRTDIPATIHPDSFFPPSSINLSIFCS